MQLADMVISEVCPENKFLLEMSETIPWDVLMEELKRRIVHKGGGRPPYSRLLLLKMHLLQSWYGLSDVQTSFQCEDRLSFRRFLGLGISDPIPDATTLENFRHALRETGLSESLNARMDQFFKERGLLLKEGTLVDATFFKANARSRRDPEEQSDIDADHGHKGFGYSMTTNVDRKSKLIRKVVTTSERPHDSQNLEAVLVGDEREVIADSGYTGAEDMLKARGIRPRILKKKVRGKKGEPAKPLALRDKYMNMLIAKLRAPVEHVYACFKAGSFKVHHVWYRGLERVNQQMQSLALAYNLKRWGFLCRG